MTINSEMIGDLFLPDEFAKLSPFLVAGLFGNTSLDGYLTVPDSPHSHEDLKNIVEKDIKDNSVMIYMKGMPDMPRCGFSSLAVRVLKVYDVPFSAKNILENPELKNAVKSVSNWPTFPQIFIKGEFIGGLDIILNMHQTGELKEKLKDVAAKLQEESE